VLGPHGVVYYDRSAPLTEAEAIDERRNGRDVVVRGGDTRSNKQAAKDVEDAVGPNRHDEPHLGPDSLPHFQADPQPPFGHCFYERKLARSKRLP
jgi:hypothetical protein